MRLSYFNRKAFVVSHGQEYRFGEEDYQTNRKLDFTLSTDYSVTMLLNPRSTSIFTDLCT